MTTSPAPTVPRGLVDFAGTTIVGVDEVRCRLDELAGHRVALVGDPRLVARLVGRLAGRATTVKVFQHDPVWVLPRLAGPAAELAGRMRTPVPRPIARWIDTALAERNLRHQVTDGWTRRQLTPSTAPTRANLVYSNRYYRALRRSDVQLVTWPIAGVVAAGIRTADGLEHHVDVIVAV